MIGTGSLAALDPSAQSRPPAGLRVAGRGENKDLTPMRGWGKIATVGFAEFRTQLCTRFGAARYACMVGQGTAGLGAASAHAGRVIAPAAAKGGLPGGCELKPAVPSHLRPSVCQGSDSVGLHRVVLKSSAREAGSWSQRTAVSGPPVSPAKPRATSLCDHGVAVSRRNIMKWPALLCQAPGVAQKAATMRAGSLNLVARMVHAILAVRAARRVLSAATWG